MPDKPRFGRRRSTGPRTRAFIAIVPTKEIKDQISQIQESMKQENFPIFWKNSRLAHISLVFLGHIAQERLSAAYLAAKIAVKRVQPFEVKTGPISYFYSSVNRNTSTIFLTVVDPEKHIQNLFRELSHELRTEEFFPQSRIFPHITIGKIKKDEDRNRHTELLSRIMEFEVPSLTLQVDQIVFLESLKSGKTRIVPGLTSSNQYKPLLSMSLRGGEADEAI